MLNGDVVVGLIELRMRTKPELVRQALGVKPGGDVTVDARKWKALLNTGIFHEIHGYYDAIAKGTVMTVHVHEAPSIAISPEVSKSVGSGVVCGIRIQDKNLSGMDQHLSMSARGDMHSGNAGCRLGSKA